MFIKKPPVRYSAPQELGPDDRMPFGKHQGELMKNVPDSYWEWMIHEAEIEDGPVRRYIEEYCPEIL